MIALTAPQPLDPALPRPWVFLAGAIDQGPWQDQAVTAFGDLPGTVIDPRRTAWDASWGTDLDDPRLAEQIAWELAALEQADAILCWLPAGARAPVSLLELGLHARRGRLVVGCPPGFRHRGNVRAVCARFAIPIHDSLTATLAGIRQRMATDTATAYPTAASTAGAPP